MPTDWRSLQDKDYLGAWDLQDAHGKPKDYTLEVQSVQSGKLKTKQTPQGKRKVVIRFKGARKGFVANSTNCETIEGMYGRNIEGWIGKRVTLYATTTSVGPKRDVPCIRVRPVVPKGAAEVVAEREVDAEQRAAQDEAFGREPGED